MSDQVELAGERIVLTHEDGRDTLHFTDTGTGRVCGGCQLCCKLLPVPGPPLHKPAGKRCQHQRSGKGCGIYEQRPFPCRVFACRWLCDAETAGLPRPDRSHYVIDMQNDYVEMTDGAGVTTRCGVIQVWVDPAHRDAHKAPSLRAYMLRMAVDYRLATIVRFGSHEALVIFPPPLCADGQWHEEAGGRIVARDADDAQVLAEARGE